MILSINTSSFAFSLSLLSKDGNVLANYELSKGDRNFNPLLASFDFIITSGGFKVKDLQGIIVARGPGSFTGLRLGLAFAKGLCHGLDIPIIGVSTMEGMANQFYCPDSLITPVLDSRKEELFTAQFRWNRKSELERTRDDESINIFDLSKYLKTPTVFIGNNFTKQVEILKQSFGSKAHMAPAHCWGLKSITTGSIGLKRFNAKDFDDPDLLEPCYLNPPDIRVNKYLSQNHFS